MTRIPPKPDREYPWWLRLFFRNQRQKYGQVLEPAKLWARVPKVFFGVATLFGALDRKSSPIDPVLRALITVRVSQINWCAFCTDINSSLVLKRGGSERKLQELGSFQTSGQFTEAEKAALEYAEAMTITDRPCTDEMILTLRQHYSDDEIVELTALIAFQNLSSKFNAALDVQPQGFCQVPTNSKDT